MGKSKHKITNWSQYNKALVNRGSITFWVDDEAMSSWYSNTQHGGRGRSNSFSDSAIETALMIKGVFGLSLRSLEGFLNSIFSLMDSPLRSPTYSCISKRAKTVTVKYRNPSRGPIAHIAIDSTGLKVFGDGEWKARKHGVEKRRTWRKLHLAVDTHTHEVIGAELSLVSVGDNEVLPTLLNPLRRKIREVSADGAYDTKRCHQILSKKGIKPIIPPRANAAKWEDGHPRNEAVSALHAGQLAQWKTDAGYHQRSLSETAMGRYKVLIGSTLTLRDYNAQVGEALAGVKAMNKLIELGMPVRNQAA